ncbi:MAG: hypothetical protein VX776_11225 [Planctomycetota bacterium]|nr:hypothetical protein [Planctomycetota bacterium]
MDIKRRCSITCFLLVVVCAGLWMFGGKDLKETALPILIRVTIFFGIFRLAYDDLLKILNYLRGPRAILLGIALIGIVAYGRAALPIVSIALGMIVLLSIFNIFQRKSSTAGKKEPRRKPRQ